MVRPQLQTAVVVGKSFIIPAHVGVRDAPVVQCHQVVRSHSEYPIKDSFRVFVATSVIITATQRIHELHWQRRRQGRHFRRRLLNTCGNVRRELPAAVCHQHVLFR